VSLDWLISSPLRTRRVALYPFYHDRSQLALSQRIREVWGETCTIQIFGGRVRIHSEDVYLNGTVTLNCSGRNYGEDTRLLRKRTDRGWPQ
jgi:hypothetical protein